MLHNINISIENCILLCKPTINEPCIVNICILYEFDK